MSTAPNFGGFDSITGDMRPANGGVMVRFYAASKKDEPASEAAGRPIFKDVDYIKKMTPGDPYNRIDRPVRDGDKEEFPVAWEAYDKSRTTKHEGLALEQWPSGTRSQVEELKYRGVFTVEELSNLDDKDATSYGVEELRERARDYLVRADTDNIRQKSQEVIKAQGDEIASLRAQLAQAQVDTSDAKKKGKG